MATKYEFFADPGHGWLKVPIAKLFELGIAEKITGYSYMRGDYAYLEEDCDYATFAEAVKANGEEFAIKEHDHSNNDSQIRRYAHWNIATARIVCRMGLSQ